MGERLLNLKEAVQNAFLDSNYVKYAEKSTWFDLHTLNQEVALSLVIGENCWTLYACFSINSSL